LSFDHRHRVNAVPEEPETPTLYGAPALDALEVAVLGAVHGINERLIAVRQGPRHWHGLLARQVFRRRTNADGRRAPEPAELDRDYGRALAGYRRAMDDVIARSGSATPSYDGEFLLALHSMVTDHNPQAAPGRWRSAGARSEDPDGVTLYEAPDPARAATLMVELMAFLNRDDGQPAVIRAAIGHLNLLQIHPFNDGNGRVARCLQTLILGHAGMVPELANLEEYIGLHTRDYNAALRAAGPVWQPTRPTRPWIRFCLTGHYRQAIALLRRVITAEEPQYALRNPASDRESDRSAALWTEVLRNPEMLDDSRDPFDPTEGGQPHGP
jgi:hypothetical protein